VRIQQVVGASFALENDVRAFSAGVYHRKKIMSAQPYVFENTVGIDTGKANIYGTLVIPDEAWAAVVFAHGSGSSRHNPRHQLVAKTLHRVGLATLLVDLLTPGEERVDQFTAQHRFDVDLLTNRLITATDWLETKCSQYDFRIGYFGASTGAAAAFKAAARRDEIAAVVSRGGRPDLAGADLSKVKAATLLLVGSLDVPVVESNLASYKQLTRAYRREVSVIPGATHLFEEKGALEEVAQLATQWFVRYLGAAAFEREGEKRITRSLHKTLDSLTATR
jgi:putative phosphoribosyl transferase